MPADDVLAAAQRFYAEQRDQLATPEGRDRFVRERFGTWAPEPVPPDPAAGFATSPSFVVADFSSYTTIQPAAGDVPPPNPWFDPDDDGPVGTLPYGEVIG